MFARQEEEAPDAPNQRDREGRSSTKKGVRMCTHTHTTEKTHKQPGVIRSRAEVKEKEARRILNELVLLLLALCLSRFPLSFLLTIHSPSFPL
jgi:hypothetical protein